MTSGDAVPRTEAFGHPKPGAIQRRCWNVLTDAVDAVTQCWLYNGHPGEHQWAEAASRYDDLIRMLQTAYEKGYSIHVATRTTCVEHLKHGDDKATEFAFGQAAPPVSLDVERAVNETTGRLIARYAYATHIGEGPPDCDASDRPWCDACWKEALDWGDPDTTWAGCKIADATYARLTTEEPS